MSLPLLPQLFFKPVLHISIHPVKSLYHDTFRFYHQYLTQHSFLLVTQRSDQPKGWNQSLKVTIQYHSSSKEDITIGPSDSNVKVIRITTKQNIMHDLLPNQTYVQPNSKLPILYVLYESLQDISGKQLLDLSQNWTAKYRQVIVLDMKEQYVELLKGMTKKDWIDQPKTTTSFSQWIQTYFQEECLVI
jgi:hypothetical protein